jgi:hypothetical protein|uniref:VQ domain-containing protein n=1 Tax=Zea mays TaxID=4577 RepID=A0A804Q5U0_MAIZE
MSSREEEGNPKPVTVKIIETVYVEAGTADDFKSVVQRFTGKDAAAELEESGRPTPSRPHPETNCSIYSTWSTIYAKP